MNVDFKIDFSFIDRLELKKLNITLDEIQGIFANTKSQLKPFSNFDYIVGFSNRRKFIHIAYKISSDPNYELQALQIDLPYEEDIKSYWCKE
ncbi:MAG: hypothetical protein ACKO1F_05845 [Flammeovirgaceae bacterium]